MEEADNPTTQESRQEVVADVMEAEEEMEDEDEADIAEHSAEKVLRLFVSALTLETTESDLREYFSKFGTVVESVACKSKWGAPKDYGFLQMSTTEETEAVLNHAGTHTLNGHVLKLQKHEETSPSIGGRLFVGGMTQETSKMDLQEYFSTFGTVVENQIARTKKGSSKGYGFVQMLTTEETEAVLNFKGNHTLFGRVLAVKKHEPKSVTAKEWKLRLELFDMNRETTEETLKAHFSPFGDVTSCTILMEEVEGVMVSRGLGFVVMASPNGVKAALGNNVDRCQVIDGTSVTVKWSLDKDVKARADKIFVGNLTPGKTTTTSITEYFSKYGTVIDINQGRKIENSNIMLRAYVFIRMEKPEEYQAVIKAHEGEHGNMLDDKVIEVRPAVTKSDQIKACKLWFSGLNQETTEEDLVEYFGTFGAVKECVIIRDAPENDGGVCKSKGYGFIVMATSNQVNYIVKFKNVHKIHGKVLVFNRVLRVNVAFNPRMKMENRAAKAGLKRPHQGDSDMSSRMPKGKRFSNRGGSGFDGGDYYEGFGNYYDYPPMGPRFSSGGYGGFQQAMPGRFGWGWDGPSSKGGNKQGGRQRGGKGKGKNQGRGRPY